MKATLLLLSILVLLPSGGNAQKTCSCTETFDWFSQKLALNYSGYRDKVPTEKKEEFEGYTARYRDQTLPLSSDTACLRLMRDWSRWFRDGHVQISYNGAQIPPDTIRRRFADWERLAEFSGAGAEASARAYLDGPGRDPLEGIYRIADGNYQILLLQSRTPERDFAAVILRAKSIWWLPGQVKFELKRGAEGRFEGRFFLRDHSARQIPAGVSDGVIEFENFVRWYRSYPGEAVPLPRNHTFALAAPDDQTVVITVPTMDESVRRELDSLVRANTALLDRTPNLILDCRNNGGGSDITFYPLRPWVFSTRYKAYTQQTYATADNIQKYALLRHNKNYPLLHRLYYGHKARQLNRHRGKMVGSCKAVTVKYRHVKRNAPRVVILMNENCASSCEQFICYAQQNERVTLMGAHTAGIFDYGNLHTMQSPCDAFQLRYPTTRSCRVDAGEGIDGIGIQPDVPIADPKADWIETARAYLKSRN